MGKPEAILAYITLLVGVGVMAIHELIREGAIWGPKKINEKLQSWLDKLEGTDE